MTPTAARFGGLALSMEDEMSTRAIYTFRDADTEVHVYKHHDGYPEGAISWIANARTLAWPLPRFEADEFAAAFVAANKTEPGGVRLVRDAHEIHVQCRYTITAHDGQLYVACDGFSGTLDEAIARFHPKWLAA